MECSGEGYIETKSGLMETTECSGKVTYISKGVEWKLFDQCRPTTITEI